MSHKEAQKAQNSADLFELLCFFVAKKILGLYSELHDFFPDPGSHVSQFFLILFYVPVWVELCNIKEWDQMYMHVRHTEAFDGDAYPFSTGSAFYWFRQLLCSLKDFGIERLFQIKHVVDMNFRNQANVSWVNRMNAEKS